VSWRSLRATCLILLGALLLAGCAPAPQPTRTAGSAVLSPPTPSLPPAPAATGEQQTPGIALPPATQTPQPTLAPTTSPTPPTPLLCSPLEGISLDELIQPDVLKNGFQPPRPGMDDGHHGVDFAYWSRGERKTMLGLPVLSAMAGKVAGVILDRQPYGNAIIIETALDAIPPGILQQITLPTQAPTVQPAASLYCPEMGEEPTVAPPSRSLYLLYAHLNQAPAVSIGQQVACGQAIGEVGTSGKSVNPHLHFETRIGPSGMVFTAMAHYENDATLEEMHNYCTWRVSGLFQMFDPLTLLEIKTLQP